MGTYLGTPKTSFQYQKPLSKSEVAFQLFKRQYWRRMERIVCPTLNLSEPSVRCLRHIFQWSQGTNLLEIGTIEVIRQREVGRRQSPPLDGIPGYLARRQVDRCWLHLHTRFDGGTSRTECQETQGYERQHVGRWGRWGNSGNEPTETMFHPRSLIASHIQ